MAQTLHVPVRTVGYTEKKWKEMDFTKNMPSKIWALGVHLEKVQAENFV